MNFREYDFAGRNEPILIVPGPANAMYSKIEQVDLKILYRAL